MSVGHREGQPVGCKNGNRRNLLGIHYQYHQLVFGNDVRMSVVGSDEG